MQEAGPLCTAELGSTRTTTWLVLGMPDEDVLVVVEVVVVVLVLVVVVVVVENLVLLFI